MNNPKVDKYLSSIDKWQLEFNELRMLISNFNLEEELKWGVPCYSYQGKNVVLIHGFKEYCALLFIKGSLLIDSSKVLIQQTKNVQAGRQIRFKNIEEINNMKDTIIDYISEAIENEKLGRKVELSKNSDLEFQVEFQKVLKENKQLDSAFKALTPGRQRAYNLFFSAPKQSTTRTSRIEKNIQNILNGKGLND